MIGAYLYLKQEPLFVAFLSSTTAWGFEFMEGVPFVLGKALTAMVALVALWRAVEQALTVRQERMAKKAQARQEAITLIKQEEAEVELRQLEIEQEREKLRILQETNGVVQNK